MNSAVLGTLSDTIDSFIGRKRHLPVASNASQAEVQQFIAAHFPLNRPNDLHALVSATSQRFERWEEHSNSPRHFGLFRPGSGLSCVAADALVALYNPNLARASF